MRIESTLEYSEKQPSPPHQNFCLGALSFGQFFKINEYQENSSNKFLKNLEDLEEKNHE